MGNSLVDKLIELVQLGLEVKFKRHESTRSTEVTVRLDDVYVITLCENNEDALCQCLYHSERAIGNGEAQKVKV